MFVHSSLSESISLICLPFIILFISRFNIVNHKVKQKGKIVLGYISSSKQLYLIFGHITQCGTSKEEGAELRVTNHDSWFRHKLPCYITILYSFIVDNECHITHLCLFWSNNFIDDKFYVDKSFMGQLTLNSLALNYARRAEEFQPIKTLRVAKL